VGAKVPTQNIFFLERGSKFEKNQKHFENILTYEKEKTKKIFFVPLKIKNFK
jgi:hypothetical protein